MTITIRTNNVPRDIVEAYELTEKERKEFDYLDWEKIEAGEDSASFFRYQGQVYDLSEFMWTGTLQDQDLKGWDGYMSDSYFSGIVVKYVNDNKQVIVGTYYS